jgi:hypothetical protein
MYLIGVYILFLGILIDDGSTFVAMLRGLTVLETNPIYLHFGIFVFAILLLSYYTALIWFWGYIINLWKRVYSMRKYSKYYKLFDVILFVLCVCLVTLSSMKIETGYNNIQLISYTYREDTKQAMQQMITDANELKESNPEQFKKERNEAYFVGMGSVSYLRALFIIICSYLLFRVGNKVAPYELA